MTWSAICLSVTLAASPSPRRFNAEPIGFGVAGLALVGLGAWRLTVADALYEQLELVPSSASRPQEAAALLASARDLVVAGKFETAVGGALVVVGGALAVASVIWFVVEGPTTRDWLVRFGPQSVSVAAQF